MSCYRLIGLFILLVSGFVTVEAIAAAERPNVILIFADDQGTLDLNCYGSKDLHPPCATIQHVENHSAGGNSGCAWHRGNLSQTA